MQMPSWMKWSIALAIGFGIVALGWKLSTNRFFFFILPLFFVINCLVLIIVVLLQSGKAADLAGAFGGAGSQTAFGPRGAANALSSATTWCAVMFMVCALALVLRADKAVGMSGTSILQQINKPTSPVPLTPAPKPAPVTPVPTTPAQQAPAPQSSAPATQPPAQQPAPPPKH
jgi:preprotein translocase subunit SecG